LILIWTETLHRKRIGVKKITMSEEERGEAVLREGEVLGGEKD